jgi:hypothetical protein
MLEPESAHRRRDRDERRPPARLVLPPDALDVSRSVILVALILGRTARPRLRQDSALVAELSGVTQKPTRDV